MKKVSEQSLGVRAWRALANLGTSASTSKGPLSAAQLKQEVLDAAEFEHSRRPYIFTRCLPAYRWWRAVTMTRHTGRVSALKIGEALDLPIPGEKPHRCVCRTCGKALAS